MTFELKFGKLRMHMIMFCLSLSLNSALAQNFINFQEINYFDGLPQVKINAMTSDELGFLWLGTNEGLYRYDGFEFELIDFPIDSLKKVTPDNFATIYRAKDNTIWAGTYDNGLYAIVPKTGKVQHFHASEENRLPANRIRDIVEDNDGNIWLSVFEVGVVSYFIEQDSFITIENDVDEVLESTVCLLHDNGKIWLGTSYGLYLYDIQKETCVFYRDFIKEQSKNKSTLNQAENEIVSITKDNQNRLWVGTYGGGLNMLDLNTNEHSNFKMDEALPFAYNKNNISEIIAYSNEKLLMSTIPNGLYTFDIKQLEFEKYSKENFNTNYQGKVSSIYQNKGGKLWVGNANSLWVKSDLNNQFSVVAFPFALRKILTSTDKPILYNSNFVPNQRPSFQIIQTDDLSYKKLSYTPLLNRNNWAIDIVSTKDGKILLREKYDIFEYNPITQKITLWLTIDTLINRQSSSGNLCSLVDSKNNLWIGTKNVGIIKVNLASKTYQVFDKNSEKAIVENGWINQIYEDKSGRIWYLTHDGFGYYDYSTDTFINFPTSKYTTNNYEKGMQNLHCIIQDSQGLFWIGSKRGGFGYFNYKKGQPIEIQMLGKGDGLRNDKVKRLKKDKNGNIWGMNALGLFRLSPKDLSIVNYGKEYGLFDNDNTDFVIDADNKIWLSFDNQFLFHIDVDSLKPKETPPKPYLKHFHIFNELYKRNIYQYDKIKLSYEQNFFSISFGAFNFFNSKYTDFAYKLEGVDENWRIVKDQRIANYTNIKGGKYTFKITARLENGDWSEMVSIQIIIKPPFWTTWWFYVLVGMSFVGIAYVIYLVRIRRIKEREQLKTEFNKKLAEVEMSALRAQMNPHFLFNCLNSIKLFIMENNTEAASTYLTKFAKLIRLILNNSKTHFVILSNELQALELYIQMEAMRLDQSFHYKIEIEPTLDSNKIEVPPLLLQPYVENAIWHGLANRKGDNRLNIKIFSSNKDNKQLLHYIIEDNGIGRTAAQALRKNRKKQQKSFGMAITKDRIILTSQLYGVDTEIHIIDLYENEIAKGTRVELSIPLILMDNRKDG